MSMLGKIHQELKTFQHLFITVCLCWSDRHKMVLEIVGVINAYFKVLQRVLEIPDLNPPTSKINGFTKNCNVLVLDSNFRGLENKISFTFSLFQKVSLLHQSHPEKVA